MSRWAILLVLVPLASCAVGLWFSYVLYPVLQIGEPFFPFAIRHGVLDRLHPLFISLWVFMALVIAVFVLVRRVSGHSDSVWTTLGETLVAAGVAFCPAVLGASFAVGSASQITEISNEAAIDVYVATANIGFLVVAAGVALLVIRWFVVRFARRARIPEGGMRSE